ncbi:MAG: HlyD family efflux transporter periplasmic adaptor subunit [Sandaracinus sp.]|nr:HlyD family efflux transporter periplasmic adaptor subunit [Sandaracinus sp.]
MTARRLGRSRAGTDAAAFLPSSRLVPSAARPRRVARNLVLAFAALVVLLSLAPWQQNLPGDGQVIAYSPDERPQAIAATISGRIARWHVVEGQEVEEGELLVELVDNDPMRLERMEIEREAAQARLTAYEEKVQAYRDRLEALRRSQQAQISAAEAEVRIAQQSLRSRQEMMAAAEASDATAQIQRRRVDGLAGEGLASQRDRELAELSSTSATASLASARAQLRAAEDSVANKRAYLERTRAYTEAELQSADAMLRSAETELQSGRQSLVSIESRLAQQRAQEVRAPRAGIIDRVLVQQGGMQVSRGQTLANLVPYTQRRAVELTVDGNDAALISPGRTVRLQFEGWPAVQFAGWPSVAVGTFGGRVAFVAPTSDSSGDFRVVIVPDENDEPWPEARFLRQGTRAKGWVLLDEVRVGFEIWRQLNGFPPSFRQAPSSDGYGAGGASYGSDYGGSDYGGGGYGGGGK